MSFSLEAGIFLLISLSAFYLVRRRFRAYTLLALSLLFIALLDLRSLAWFIASGILVYLFGLIAEKTGENGNSSRKPFMIAIVSGIILCVSALLLFKCADFLPLPDRILSHMILPLGFSYYIFQAISYLADIGSGKIHAQKNPAMLLLYLCFFPKFISGPIERPYDMMSQFEKLGEVKLFEGERLSHAFACMLYGFFMKVVVADRLSIHTQVLLNDPQNFSSLWLIAGMFMYTMQIYCDFAGYSSVAIGCAELFGIRLTQNFRAPYLATDISVFWRRWHISLSNWLKDYVYIPLGGSRKGLLRRCVNTMIVFLICGIWHGTGFNFVIWGLLHGIYSIISILWKKTGLVIPAWISRIITFLAVSFAWVFFGVSGAGTGIRYVTGMLTAAGGWEMTEQIAALSFTAVDWLIPVYVAIVFFLDWLLVRKDRPFEERVFTYRPVKRYTIYYLLILAIFLLGAYGPSYNAGDFMYMRF